MTQTCECEQPWCYEEIAFLHPQLISHLWERITQYGQTVTRSQMTEGQCSDCRSLLLPDGRAIHERKGRRRRLL